MNSDQRKGLETETIGEAARRLLAELCERKRNTGAEKARLNLVPANDAGQAVDGQCNRVSPSTATNALGGDGK